jgi:hypothetical protein
LQFCFEEAFREGILPCKIVKKQNNNFSKTKKIFKRYNQKNLNKLKVLKIKFLMSRKPLAICAWTCGSFGNFDQKIQFPLPCKKTSDVSQTSDVW